jgi:signal transduction histidine kinase
LSTSQKLNHILIQNPKRLYLLMSIVFLTLCAFASLKINTIYDSAYSDLENSSARMLKIYNSELETNLRTLQEESTHLIEAHQHHGLDNQFQSIAKVFLNRYSNFTDSFIIINNKSLTRFNLAQGNSLNSETLSEIPQPKIKYEISYNSLNLMVPLKLEKYISTLRLPTDQAYLISFIPELGESFQYWHSKSLNKSDQCKINLENIQQNWVNKATYYFEETQMSCNSKFEIGLTSFYPISVFGRTHGLSITLLKAESFTAIDAVLRLMIFLSLTIVIIGFIFFYYAHRIQKYIDHEQRESDARLVQASKLSSLGEMSGNIAHEINNPIAVILSSVQLLKKEIANESLTAEKGHKQTDRIEQMVLRISKIIKALRTFSRDAETVDYDINDLCKIVDESLDLLREKAKTKDIQIIWDPKFDLYFSKTNYIQIGQVLINLISNSFDSLMADPEATGKYLKIEVSTVSNKNYIIIEDNGPGISVELQERIFEPFFTTKPVGQGTGLGLSISIGIIKNHFGKLRIEHRHHPTRFSIELPSVTKLKQVG